MSTGWRSNFNFQTGLPARALQALPYAVHFLAKVGAV